MVAVTVTGCGSAPSASHPTSTTQPPSKAPHATTTSISTPSTTTTTGPTVTALPASVNVQISGATATVQFSSASLTGVVNPTDGAFSQGGTVYTFTVTGVSYSGAPTTKTASGGLIASVTVGPDQNEALVTVKLSSPASHASFGEGHDEVGVEFS